MKSSTLDRYFANKEKGIVVSKLSRLGAGRTVIDEMGNKLGYFGVELMSAIFHQTDFLDIDDGCEDYFIGIAKCKKPDEFSEKTGRQIADIKAEYKYHSAMQRKYQQIIRRLHETLRVVEDLELEHRNKMARFDEKLKKFM